LPGGRKSAGFFIVYFDAGPGMKWLAEKPTEPGLYRVAEAAKSFLDLTCKPAF
jgi:hypothetical protein